MPALSLAMTPEDLRAIAVAVVDEMEARARVPEPAPEPAPVPEPAPTVIQGPVLHRDAPGLRLSNMEIIGGLTLVNCPDAVLSRMKVTGSTGHGVNLIDCPAARISDVESFGNGRVREDGMRIGHGLHLNGDCQGIVVERLHSHDNIEDGVQRGTSSVGLVRFAGIDCHDNGENALDLKGGVTEIAGSTLRQTTRDETVVLHQNAVSLLVTDTLIEGHEKAPLVRVVTGAAELRGCTYIKPIDTRWFIAGGTVWDRVETLDAAALKIVP